MCLRSARDGYGCFWLADRWPFSRWVLQGVADSFLAYPPGISKPLIIVVEATLTLSIGVTLALLVAGPPERLPQQ